VSLINHPSFGNRSVIWVVGGAVVLISWGLFKYLVAPLALEKGQENRWALVGVPLILISWGAFLFGVFYAMCAVMTGGKIFMH